MSNIQINLRNEVRSITTYQLPQYVLNLVNHMKSDLQDFFPEVYFASNLPLTANIENIRNELEVRHQSKTPCFVNKKGDDVFFDTKEELIPSLNYQLSLSPQPNKSDAGLIYSLSIGTFLQRNLNTLQFNGALITISRNDKSLKDLINFFYKSIEFHDPLIATISSEELREKTFTKGYYDFGDKLYIRDNAVEEHIEDIEKLGCKVTPFFKGHVIELDFDNIEFSEEKLKKVEAVRDLLIPTGLIDRNLLLLDEVYATYITGSELHYEVDGPDGSYHFSGYDDKLQKLVWASMWHGYPSPDTELGRFFVKHIASQQLETYRQGYKIRWYIGEEDAANQIQNIFENEGTTDIEVKFVPYTYDSSDTYSE